MKTILTALTLAFIVSCTPEQVPTPLCDCTTYTWMLVQRDGCLRQDTTDVFSFKGDCSRNNTGGIDRESGVVRNTLCK
jgi:hypothetical protein